MDISIDIFKQNKIKYDWKTLYMGLKLDLVKYSDIVNYAVEYLIKYPEVRDESIIQLAWSGEDIDYDDLLTGILKESNVDILDLDADDWQFERTKWRFAVLAYLKANYQDDFKALLNTITEVYADFGYPEDMDSFINYMKPKRDEINPPQYSKEDNIIRLINLFNDFMNKEHHYLQKNNNN